MHSAIRGLATFVAAVTGFYFTLWFVGPVLLPDATPNAIHFIASLTVAGLAARFMWIRLGDPAHGLVNAIGVGALMTGAVGFVGGFFGPMVLAPEANQGPMLGIFITGPLGFVVGGVGGAVYWLRRARDQSRRRPV